MVVPSALRVLKLQPKRKVRFNHVKMVTDIICLPIVLPCGSPISRSWMEIPGGNYIKTLCTRVLESRLQLPVMLFDVLNSRDSNSVFYSLG